MDTRAEGFTAGPLSEDDMTIWEAKLWLAEGTLALDLMQYHEHHGYAHLPIFAASMLCCPAWCHS